MTNGADTRDLVAFLTVEQRAGDAVRFPGDFTQLLPLGEGQEVADQWNSENLAGLQQEHDERWGNDDPAAAGEDGRTGPPVRAECPRCHIGADVAGWCDVCGMDLKPDATHPRFSLQAHDREVLWGRTQEAEQRFQGADTEWTHARDVAVAAGGEDFNRLKWVSENPRPTVKGIYEDLHGSPYPDLRPKVERKPAPPQPPSGARVEQLEAAWHATLEGGAEADFARILAGPGPIPRKEIASLVADLTSDGWAIVNWSDERRVIHEDEISRTEIAGITAVLHKPPGGKR